MHFCGGANHSAETFIKSIRRVIQTTYERNRHLENVLDVDLKITPNFKMSKAIKRELEMAKASMFQQKS